MTEIELRALIKASNNENPLKVYEGSSYVEEFIKAVAKVSKDNPILDKKIKEGLRGAAFRRRSQI